MPTLADIRKKIQELKAQEEELVNKDKADVISRMHVDIENYGITADDLGFNVAKATKKSKEPKTAAKVVMYRKGDLTWSGGRGRKPQWVQEIYEKHQNDDAKARKALEEFKV